MAGNLIPLDVPGAAGTVELKGAQGIFYSILVDGVALSRRGGGWTVPLRNGKTARITARGMIPGFQTLYLGEQELYRFGAHASRFEKIAMFAPLLLVLSASMLGFVLAILLFFSSVLVVKNSEIPDKLRIALPLINTCAGAMILVGLAGIAGS
ncbi:hypothetical protein [Demequina sp. NBRC 110057]|uniref:hypothetical protein n=1 Tax=Demequina sp. NBRC 110057 TaxID=1570346 RepID=UPI000A041B3E|nr:hypothetical protein [Demequina sp. NBRC 110057]